MIAEAKTKKAPRGWRGYLMFIGLRDHVQFRLARFVEVTLTNHDDMTSERRQNHCRQPLKSINYPDTMSNDEWRDD